MCTYIDQMSRIYPQMSPQWSCVYLQTCLTYQHQYCLQPSTLEAGSLPRKGLAVCCSVLSILYCVAVLTAAKHTRCRFTAEKNIARFTTRCHHTNGERRCLYGCGRILIRALGAYEHVHMYVCMYVCMCVCMCVCSVYLFGECVYIYIRMYGYMYECLSHECVLPHQCQNKVPLRLWSYTDGGPLYTYVCIYTYI